MYSWKICEAALLERFPLWISFTYVVLNANVTQTLIQYCSTSVSSKFQIMCVKDTGPTAKDFDKVSEELPDSMQKTLVCNKFS